MIFVFCALGEAAMVGATDFRTTKRYKKEMMGLRDDRKRTSNSSLVSRRPSNPPISEDEDVIETSRKKTAIIIQSVSR